MSRKFLVVGVAVAALLVFAFTAAYASVYNGRVDLSCTDWSALNTGSHILNRDNTGIGHEQLRIDITDGAGTLIYTLTYENFLTTFGAGIGSGIYSTAPKFNPITFKLTSLAGNGLPEQVDFVQSGNCAGLPTFATCLPLTSFAVVGDMPFTTQAYWAPGKVSPGLTINPGTYWVLGADASGGYYKILLACQYLWVPSNAMQPSFQPPWQGQPLPTQNVE